VNDPGPATRPARPERRPGLPNDPLEGQGFKWLLALLLGYIVGSPFLDRYPSLEVLAHLLLTSALAASVCTVRRKGGQRSWATVVVLALLLLFWLGVYDLLHYSRIGALVLLVTYFGLLITTYVEALARIRQVSVAVLQGALCLYLILGLFWGSLYTLLETVAPGSYRGLLLEQASPGAQLHVFNYFSMVTLTTLGYGDITPQTPGAGALCQMEAIIGQFYTAVIVAWLVGTIASQRRLS